MSTYLDSGLAPASPAAEDGALVKRPPEDDEPFDLYRTPPKRQAVEPSLRDKAVPELEPSPSLRDQSSQVPSESDQSLQSKSTEQLIAIIRDMQAAHAHQVADLETRYSFVSTQLDQMKKLLNTYFKSQEQGIHSISRELALITAAKSTASSSPGLVANANASVSNNHDPPSASLDIPSQANFTQGAAATSTPHSVATRREELQNEPSSTQPLRSSTPSTLTADSKPQGKVELKIIPSVLPNEPPIVEPSRLDTVLEVWQEYRYGHNGNPSLESLDALWGARWRPDQKLRLWYGRRKAILDQIKTYIADGIDEDTAVAEVEKLRRGRTLNWLSRILLDDRKQTKKERKEAQKAATAAKQAMEGAPVVGI